VAISRTWKKEKLRLDTGEKEPKHTQLHSLSMNAIAMATESGEQDLILLSRYREHVILPSLHVNEVI